MPLVTFPSLVRDAHPCPYKPLMQAKLRATFSAQVSLRRARRVSGLTHCVVLGTKSDSDLASLRGIDGGFVHQHDGDVVFDGIDAAALGAFERLSFVFQFERLFAERADEKIEQLLRNHGRILGERGGDVKFYSRTERECSFLFAAGSGVEEACVRQSPQPSKSPKKWGSLKFCCA